MRNQKIVDHYRQDRYCSRMPIDLAPARVKKLKTSVSLPQDIIIKGAEVAAKHNTSLSNYLYRLLVADLEARERATASGVRAA